MVIGSNCVSRCRSPDNGAYFDHAAVAPVSGPARDAVQNWLVQATEQGDTRWPEWSRSIEETRINAARLLNAEPCEIALVPNTTSGISLVAEGFPWTSGDNVVTLANEFPSNQYPWLNLKSRGVETRRVEFSEQFEIDQLVQACDQRTRLISVSWVSFSTGWRLDLDQLADIAHKQGVYLFVDAIQGLGVFPMDVRQTEVDFLAADGHKWLLGPEGAGVFYLKKQHLDVLRPIGVGWNSVTGRFDYAHIELNLRNEAARYEGGTWNTPGLIGLGASLDFLTRFGAGPSRSAIAERVLELTDLCCERLLAAGATIASSRQSCHRSGIVSFQIPNGDPKRFRDQCLEARVALSCRDGRVRISPHAYCNEEDIDRLSGCRETLPWRLLTRACEMCDKQRVLVFLATYNEIDNLPKLVDLIRQHQPGVHILVIDDHSPDGTGQWCESRKHSDSAFECVHREGKLGLGTAMVEGLQYAIENHYDLLVTMDADGSHHPRYIPDLLRRAKKDSGIDVVIGSRYVSGGRIKGWPMHRRLMSRWVNAYSRTVLGLKPRDCSGSFRCYRVAKLGELTFSRIQSQGYSFFEEILFHLAAIGITHG